MTKESLDITSYCMRGRNKLGTCIADDGRVMIEKFTTFELILDGLNQKRRIKLLPCPLKDVFKFLGMFV